MAEEAFVIEWRIENFSHWSADVHGHCVKSPRSIFCHYNMELYPKGISGQGEHLVIRLFTRLVISCELSFCSSDGSLLGSKQQVNSGTYGSYVELPSGPKFEDVLSRIRATEDFITVRLWVKRLMDDYHLMSTTVNGLKILFKINPAWIEKMKSGDTRRVWSNIYFSPYDSDGYVMELSACSENGVVHFMINPPTKFEYPFAVEMCLSLARSDGTVDTCVKKEHVFLDQSPWTFPDPLQKKELAGKEISLFLCLKTKNVIQNYFCANSDNSCVSIQLNTPCFSTKEPSTDTVASNQIRVFTQDSGSHTSDMPDDPVLVLSKELMCLYQDQKFSDITLKCDNVTFPVHKNILSARSPVLDRLLSSDMKESASGEVDIGDLDPSTLSLFLSYLYTGAVEEELQCDRALKLYYAADKYQVPSLKKECGKFLRSNVSVSNVCDVLSLADKHGDDELTAVSHDFILDNFNVVLGSQEWATLKKNEPILVAETLTQFAVEGRVRKHHPQ